MSLIDYTGSGAFATSRRGGLTGYEIEWAKDLKARRHGVQSIARILGRPQEDVSRLFNTPPVFERAPEPPAKAEISQPVLRFGFTVREARLFDAFAAGAMLSDDEIVRLVAGRISVDSTYVTTLIRKVRVKVQPHGLRVENLKGRGYRLSRESLMVLGANPDLGKPREVVRCGPQALAVLQAVAKDHGLDVSDLRCRSRSRARVEATHDAMSRLWATGRYSLIQIGRFLDRDHSSVSHGIRAHREAAKA